MTLQMHSEAAHLAEIAGLDIELETTSEVIDMLVQGTRQQADMIGDVAVGFDVTGAMLVAMAGRAMGDNATALDRLAEVAESRAAALSILQSVQEAAEDALVRLRPSK